MKELVEIIFMSLTILFFVFFLSSTKQVTFAYDSNAFIFAGLKPKTIAFF